MATTQPKPNLPFNEKTENNIETQTDEKTATAIATANNEVLPTTKFAEVCEFDLKADSEPEKFNECLHKINEEFGKVVVLVLKLGKALTERKKNVKRGNWGSQFGKGGFAFSQRSANCYMSIYANRDLLTGGENSIQQMLEVVNKGKTKTKKPDKIKSYIYKYEMTGYENLGEIAEDYGVSEENISQMLGAAINERLEQLKGNKSC